MLAFARGSSFVAISAADSREMVMMTVSSSYSLGIALCP